MPDNTISPPPIAGLVRAVEPGSWAAGQGLAPGDAVTHVNGHPVEDVIDVQFYAADDYLEVELIRDGEEYVAEGPRAEGQPLGIEFTHPTFDIDIRRCNNLCPFCFVLQTAPRMRRALYIKDDDYRYSFLHGHFVTLTNLTGRDWERVERQRLSPLYVSVHATDPDVRRRCLANPTAPDIMGQLRWLAERGLRCHTQLVITPGLNDGPLLAQSVADLAGLWPAVQSVSVVPVGLTRHHRYGLRPNTVAETHAVLDAVEAWGGEYLARFGVRFVYATDEWYLVAGRPPKVPGAKRRGLPPRFEIDGLELEENGLGQVRRFLDEWTNLKSQISNLKLPKGRATLVTGTLFASTLEGVAREFNRLAEGRGDTRGRPLLAVVPVVNQRLGETITVAGLLMARDIIAQLAGRELGQVVVLPRVAFDHPQGISLDDLSPLDVARALGTPVALADLMGDVLDALTGANRLTFRPQDETIPPEVMKAGGWSVEKVL